MKKSIVSTLALLLALTGCGSNGNANVKKDAVYSYVYTTDPDSFNYVTTGHATNSDHLTNFVDGMLEMDNYGQLVGALSESYDVNDDATEFTFHLKKGVKWYTADGEEYAEVKADDFLAGLQHAIEFDADALYMLQGVIKNLDEYYAGKITDFSEVGIEAVDEYTVKYTLTTPTPYFHTMTTYGVLYPINRSFLESKGVGCKLGAADPASCTFGLTEPTGILYNGAFVLTNYTAKSVIEYSANPNYYDKKNVHVSKVKLIFSDGSDGDSYFRGYDAGEYTQAPIYTDNEATYKLASEKYGDSIYTSKLTSTSFYMSFNLDREAFASFNDNSAAGSKKNDKQKNDTKLAVLNKNFRKAIMYGMNRGDSMAQRSGDALRYNALRNTITMPEFVTTSDGRLYSTLVAEALENMNPEWAGIDLSDSQDGIRDTELSKKYAEAAKAELLAAGCDLPIVMEQVLDQTAEKLIRMAQALNASIEATLGTDLVKFNIILTDKDNANYSDYYARQGSQKNFDFSTSVGWGPDYGDPRTYVDILDPETGAILSNIGLDVPSKRSGKDDEAMKSVGYDEFVTLLHTANDTIEDLDARYEAYAKAEAWLIDNAILIPLQSQGGLYAITKVVPYTAPYSFYGISDGKYKYMQIQEETVTLKQRDEAKKAWEIEKASK